MERRIVYVSKPARLGVRKNQLSLEIEQETHTVPLEDMLLLELDNQQTNLTGYLLQQLCEYRIPLLVNNDKHMPIGMYIPLVGNTRFQKVIQHQTDAPQPLKKQLWAILVKRKIENQAAVLHKLGLKNAAKLKRLANNVKSGDTENLEAQAAVTYFSEFELKRERGGAWPNPVFNYAYAIMRAIIARAICEAGLLPFLGIWHKNEYNPYPLADDLIEPFRPLIDEYIYRQFDGFADETTELTKEAKIKVLNLVDLDVKMGTRYHKLPIAARFSAISLAQVYLKKRKSLFLPMIQIKNEVYA